LRQLRCPAGLQLCSCLCTQRCVTCRPYCELNHFESRGLSCVSELVPCQVLTSLSAVSEARVGKMRPRARWDCALSIQRLEGSRPWLRRTRALWGFNNGKERV